MRFLTLLALVLIPLGLASCGDDDGGDSLINGSNRTTPSPAAAGGDPQTNITVQVYLARQGEGGLAAVPVPRTIAGGGSLGKSALEAMIAGPTKDEVAQGYTTAISGAGKVLDLANTSGVVTVNFSAGTMPAAGSATAQLARSQVERTLRQFPGVTSVVIQVDGTVFR
jgi:spore germination protein GerM